MNVSTQREAKWESWAFGALVGAVFASAFTLPGGRWLLGASVVLTVIQLVRERRAPAFPAVAWLGLTCILIAVCTTIWGMNPARGIPKLTKLIWFIGIPLCATLVTGPSRIWMLVRAYACGCGVLGVLTCVRHTVKARELVALGQFDRFSDALVHVGSMSDAQRLMVGVLLALGLLLASRGVAARSRWGWGCLLGVIAVGLLINFKRGAWFSTVGVVTVFLIIRAGWRYAVAIVLLALCLLAVPTVRTRVAGLKDELSGRGGRMMMWREIAPELHRQYPWGVGYRALTNDAMREIEPRVEPNRDHLHSNPIQMWVDTGWLGLAVYLLWMGWSCTDAMRFCVRMRRDPAALALALALGMGLAALLFNGLVEYNFGDGEIVLAYGWMIGTLAAGAAARNETRTSLS